MYASHLREWLLALKLHPQKDIICCYERVGEGPRGSGGACPSRRGVAGWMISLTKGIFCNPFPAVPGHRLTKGHRDSLGELAGGCREVAECLCSAFIVNQAAGQRAERAHVGLRPMPPRFRAAFSVFVAGRNKITLTEMPGWTSDFHRAS